MMSKMRPECGKGNPWDPCPTNGTAYLMILNAVESRPGLITGKLEAQGEFCAIGSYFHVNPRTSLPTAIIDEVAMVNDSMVNVTPRQRRDKMKQFLRWKLACLGMKGFKLAPFPEIKSAAKGAA